MTIIVCMNSNFIGKSVILVCFRSDVNYFHGVNYFFQEVALHQHFHRREDVSLFCCYVTARRLDA